MGLGAGLGTTGDSRYRRGWRAGECRLESFAGTLVDHAEVSVEDLLRLATHMGQLPASLPVDHRSLGQAEVGGEGTHAHASRFA